MYSAEFKQVIKLTKDLKNLKEQNDSQHDMYELTTIYSKKLNDDLKKSELKLIAANKDLTDSINYSKHIQDAFLVNIDDLKKLFPNSFMFQKNKDIVGGDFVWTFKDKTNIYLGLGDCTGHGIPGAMLTIFMVGILNQIVSNFQDESPYEVLVELDILIQKYLSQYHEQIRDTSEIALLKYNTINKTIEFSGIKRPLLHVRGKILTIYKGGNHILGNTADTNDLIENVSIKVKENDMIYLFSDGFADQFGGEKNKKFSSKNLKTLLQDISNQSIDSQNEQIVSTFTKWIGDNSQTDDVLLVGIRF
jgi:serine phosphatase RsbU (regulator of sigma subunit)